MTVAAFIELLSADIIVLFFYFILLPIIAVIVTMASGNDGNQSPYNYLCSTLIYLVTIPGILSLTFWVYSLAVGGKSLWTLNFAVYYLPVISMVLTLFIIAKKASIKSLPWFGELYELLGMIAGVFGFILLLMHLQVVKFGHWWQILLVFIVLFGILKLSWERLMRMAR